jgi:hypothetical protein
MARFNRMVLATVEKSVLNQYQLGCCQCLDCLHQSVPLGLAQLALSHPVSSEARPMEYQVRHDRLRRDAVREQHDLVAAGLGQVHSLLGFGHDPWSERGQVLMVVCRPNSACLLLHTRRWSAVDLAFEPTQPFNNL